jgi:hypothetical protein
MGHAFEAPSFSARVLCSLGVLSVLGPSACNDQVAASAGTEGDASAERAADGAGTTGSQPPVESGDASAEQPPSDAASDGAFDADAGPECVDHGVRHAPRDAWTCSDGCNSCFCLLDNGVAVVSSTLAFCAGVVVVGRDADLNCPEIMNFGALPADLVDDQPSMLTVTFSGEGAVVWSASSGTFSLQGTRTTEYTCSGSESEPTVRVQVVPFDDSCVSPTTLTVPFSIRCMSSRDASVGAPADAATDR